MVLAKPLALSPQESRTAAHAVLGVLVSTLRPSRGASGGFQGWKNKEIIDVALKCLRNIGMGEAGEELLQAFPKEGEDTGEAWRVADQVQDRVTGAPVEELRPAPGQKAMPLEATEVRIVEDSVVAMICTISQDVEGAGHSPGEIRAFIALYKKAYHALPAEIASDGRLQALLRKAERALELADKQLKTHLDRERFPR